MKKLISLGVLTLLVCPTVAGAQQATPPAQQAAPTPQQQAAPQGYPPQQQAAPQGYPPQQQAAPQGYPPQQQAAPQQGYPPGAYPVGYAPAPAYIGPVPGSNPEFLKFTTPELEEELDDTGLGAPIVFLSIGVPALLIGTPWLIGSFIARGNCETVSDSYLSGYYQSNCRDSYNAALVVSGMLMGAGLTFTTLGAIFLPKRISERHSLSKEIELRKHYGRTSFFELRHGPVPTPGGGFSYGFMGTF